MSQHSASVRHTLSNSASTAGILDYRRTKTTLLLVVLTM